MFFQHPKCLVIRKICATENKLIKKGCLNQATLFT